MIPRWSRRRLLAAGAALPAAGLAAGLSAGLARADAPRRPLVIAHRGASGLLPEHTLEAYALAIEQGADYVEPDLVMTADGALVARHDRFLGTTTDVARRPEFAGRRRVKPGRREAEWWVEDFTLAEIRTLRAVQPFPGRPTDHDGRYGVPTLPEILELLQREAARSGRVVGIYPEAKQPAAFAALGLDMKAALLDALAAAGWGGVGAPVFLQCFDPGFLQALRGDTALPLVQLVAPRRGGAPGEPTVPLQALAGWADAVGPSKALLFDAGGRPRDFMARARDLGLAVHAWTLRDDRPAEAFGSVEAEYEALFALGVEGLFTDFPDSMIRAWEAWAG